MSRQRSRPRFAAQEVLSSVQEERRLNRDNIPQWTENQPRERPLASAMNNLRTLRGRANVAPNGRILFSSDVNEISPFESSPSNSRRSREQTLSSRNGATDTAGGLPVFLPGRVTTPPEEFRRFF